MFTNVLRIPEIALPDEFRLNPNTSRVVADDLRDAIAYSQEDWVNAEFTLISANQVTNLRREVFKKMNAKGLAYHNDKHGRDMETRVIL